MDSKHETPDLIKDMRMTIFNDFNSYSIVVFCLYRAGKNMYSSWCHKVSGPLLWQFPLFDKNDIFDHLIDVKVRVMV